MKRSGFSGPDAAATSAKPIAGTCRALSIRPILRSLCPAGQDVFAWAEHHLRALIHHSYPSLVPARNEQGHCHWHFDGKCAVHENAPYSCAFFDSHMSDEEVDRRAAATIQACRDDAAANGLYYRVWLHLHRKGLIGKPGDRDALIAEVRRMSRRAESNWRRAQRIDA